MPIFNGGSWTQDDEPRGRIDTSSFWLCWNPLRAAGPVVRHDTLKDATTEAKRLASKHPGETFYVLTWCTAYVEQQMTLSRGLSAERLIHMPPRPE